MLSQFQASYQRVEQSLQQLTESIAAYNPSTTAAAELVAADEAVNENLEQLVTHQSNHQRIQALRRTTASLDETLRRTIQLLADTRRDILAIPPVDTADEPKREVRVEELLSYAKFISKTTVPPTFRKQDVPPLPNRSEEKGEGGAGGAEASGNAAAAATTTTNGKTTPPARDENVGTKVMDEDVRRWLDPLKGLPFEPWPSHAAIQRGVLADIQRIIESGRDPAGVLTAEEQADADRRRREEEERDRAALDEAETRRMNLFDTAVAAKRRETAADVFDPDDL